MGRDNRNFMRTLGTISVFLIGLIASLIAIFQFLTGWQSIGEFFSDITNPAKVEATPISPSALVLPQTPACLTASDAPYTSIVIRADNLDGYEDANFHISGDGNANNWVGTEPSVIAGWIFTHVDIPIQATILCSFIRFRGFGNNGNAIARIKGFAEDYPMPFSPDGSNRPSTRPTTNAYVDWTNNWTYQWQWYQTPDLSSIIQEIITRPGWNRGNSMGFQISNPVGAGTNWAIVDFSGNLYQGRESQGHSVTLYVFYAG